jgi:colicin import membrane protein
MKHLAILFWGMAALHGAVAQETTLSAASRSLTSADKAYVAAIINKLRANVLYDDSSHGSENPKVVYRVLLLPTGEVMSVDRVLESGTPDFDTAVQKGIWRASPLPKRSDGQVEHALVIEYSLQSPKPTAALTH